MPRAIRLAPPALVIILCCAPEGWAQTSVTLRGPAAVNYACTFRDSWTECRFAEQAKVRGRASLVDIAGMRGVRLHTRPGDSNVAGSGDAERNDLTLSQGATDCYEGREQWWAHSILFPDDYVDPPASTRSQWNWGVVFDFHNSAPGEGQANFQINAMPATAIAADRPTGLNFQVAYGSQTRPTVYNAPIGPVVRNVWYHFVYHVKWSSGAGGYITAWVNGARKMHYKGPTLYAGQGCYLKLANYHSAFGKPSSVIHARVLRGTTPDAVALGPLQGVLPGAGN
ncbi:MAG: heparin lyase I family protein [Burkholderiales bacterium]